MLKKISLSVISLALTLFIIEVVMRYREINIMRQDLSCLRKSNINYLVGRSAEDFINLPFFNRCFIDKRIVAKDPVLGYVNIPNVDGYLIRVYGRPNLVVKQSFDLSIFDKSGLRTEIAPFHINNLGNRGPEMSLEKPADVARIVFLGDSITFGYYIKEQDTFVRRVESGIASTLTLPCTIEAINAGVSSLNAHLIANHLKERVLLYNPDLIVWGFYVNDIVDRISAEEEILFPIRSLGWLSFFRLTALGRFIGERIFSTEIGARLNVDVYDVKTILVEGGWVKVERDLMEVQRLLNEHNIPLVVVILPSAIQFSRRWTTPSFQGRLKRLCEKYHIPYIDLLPLFEKNGPASNLYYSGDSIHPNPKGHALIADAILSFLKNNPQLLRGCYNHQK